MIARIGWRVSGPLEREACCGGWRSTFDGLWKLGARLPRAAWCARARAEVASSARGRKQGCRENGCERRRS